MNRVDRLLAIITVLQSKKYVMAEQLAEKFEISIRTVYRDVKALAEVGVPVSFEPNKGYFLVQGYFLPPVLYTAEEANALVLMGAIAHRFADQSIQKHYESALGKVKAVLKGAQKEKLEQLSSQIKTFKPDCLQNDFGYLAEIQHAISNKIILKIEYINNQQEVSSREVEPIGLLFYSMNWHMIAWCWNRREYRDFRLSRILELRGNSALFRKSAHIDLNTYLLSLPQNF